ncbi:hypothetical protein [Herbiconiux liangxiaofengii]|uniref:hypothetical protein n=1 Tax=Herbiconiux liangxiaofengii TaxID=3342795 RepID=UPI0035B7EF20
MLSVFVYRAIHPLDVDTARQIKAGNLVLIETEAEGHLTSLWPNAAILSFRFEFESLSGPDEAVARGCHRAVNAALNGMGVPYLTPRDGSGDARRKLSSSLPSVAAAREQVHGSAGDAEALQHLFDSVQTLSGLLEEMLRQRQ